MTQHTARTSQSTPHRMRNPVALMVALLITITILLPDVSVGQTKEPPSGIIAGRVYDSYSKQALYYSNVWIEPIMKGTQAQEGRFKIQNIPPGTYRLVVSHETYKRMVIEKIKISNNDSLFFNVGITPIDTLTNEFYSLRLTSIQEAISMAEKVAARYPLILKPTPFDPNEVDKTTLRIFGYKYDTISPIEYQSAFNKRMLKIMSKHYREEEISYYDSLISSWK
ncbi:MAG: carboxypeptidase-like regulatory domain-containing protein [Bacteroidetes bacterium]|nr:carboxypeptidase-like regulatory domain-containing protein [Bacteroidota bacterium]